MTSCTPDVEGGEGLPRVQLQRDYLEHATVEVEGDDTAPRVHQPDLPALRRPPHTVLPEGEGENRGQGSSVVHIDRKASYSLHYNEKHNT